MSGEQQPMGGAWEAAFKALFSMRIHWMGAVAAAISSVAVAFVLDKIGLSWLGERTLYFIAFPVWALVVVASAYMAYTGDSPLYCHSCGKRVKMNYTRCHHCLHEHKSPPPTPHGHDHGGSNPPPPPAPTLPPVPVAEFAMPAAPAQPPVHPPQPSPDGRADQPSSQWSSPAVHAAHGSTGSLMEAVQRIEFAVAPNLAFEKVRDALERTGKVTDVNEVTRSLRGKMRYGLAAVSLHISVSSGPQPDSSVVQFSATGQDVWQVGARRSTDKLLAAIR